MPKLLSAIALSVLATLTLAGTSRAASLAPRVDRVASPTVSVHFLDIGQGDAILIRTADDKAVMLDAGPPESRGSMLDRLRALGITSLDALIMTHAHADHVGGAKMLLETFPVKLVLDPGFAHTSAMYAGILETIEKKGIRYRQPRRSFKVRLGEHAELQFLSPEDPLLSGTRSDPNANSFVIKLSAGDVDVMLTGDAEAETEARVLGTKDVPMQCEVLKVAHHGSEYSTTAAFLDAVHPTAAVISVGASNRYGHPAPPTLLKLDKAGVVTYRTDTDGEVVLETDGRSWSLVAAHPGARPASGAGTPGPPSATGAGLIDINGASVAELTKLPGIGKSKAQAIVDHRASNGPFGSVEDLTKVRGIGRKTMEALAPLAVAGSGTPGAARMAEDAPQATGGAMAEDAPRPPAPAGGGLDLNAASESQLVSLPGIGRVKAQAIIAWRQASGPFTSVDQLRQVKGIGAKTLDALRPLVRVGPGGAASPRSGDAAPTAAPAKAAPAGALIDLNAAGESELVRLPGIGPAKARAIIEYRTQAGGFGSVEQLRSVKGIGEKTMEQLRPLVTVGKGAP